MKLETKFRQKVDHNLKRLKNSWFESIQQRSINGTPDKIGCVNGFFVGMELKTTRGAATPLQDKKLDDIARAGGCGFLVNPNSWELTFMVLCHISHTNINWKNRVYNKEEE